jgi:hypothetical protein
MPITVKAVPGKPYGAIPRFCLRIESGYQAGQLVTHAGSESPVHWPNQADAEQWARDTGYTLAPSASTQLLVNLFETFQDFQFEGRDISGADLVDDLGRWLREHKAEVAGMAPTKADPAAQKLKELFTAFRAQHAGNSEVNGADLVDDFGEWLRETQQCMHELTGAPFVAMVARIPEGTAYWRDRFGWGKLDDATAFFETVPEGLRSDVMAEWVVRPLAAELDAQVEPGDSPRG